MPIQDARRLSVPFSDMFIAQAISGQVPARDEVTNKVVYETIKKSDATIKAVDFDKEAGILHFIKNDDSHIEINGLPTIPKFGYGPTGPRGPQGQDGRDGNEGKAGKPGLRGCPGPAGPQGLPGEQGKQGSDGKQGPEGLDGCPGDKGPQGPEGPEGPEGFQGPCGPMGCNGIVNGLGVPGLPGINPDPYVIISSSEPSPAARIWGILQI